MQIVQLLGETGAGPLFGVQSSGADPGFCEGGFERGFVDSLKGIFEQK